MSHDISEAETRAPNALRVQCAACGADTDNSYYGHRDTDDWLPCCGNCYCDGRLREWLDRRDGNAPTDEKLTDAP